MLSKNLILTKKAKAVPKKIIYFFHCGNDFFKYGDVRFFYSICGAKATIAAQGLIRQRFFLQPSFLT